MYNVHFFGGILIDKENEKRLVQIIKSVKSEYTHPNLPMKWNFRDNSIKDKFSEFSRLEEYNRMLRDSNIWRKKIIEQSLELDYLIIFGLIKSYSNDKKKG